MRAAGVLPRTPGTGQALAAGIAASVLGYGSSIAVVVAGLTAVGASTRQVSSGLLVMGLVIAGLTVGASIRLRMPISIVWTTRGWRCSPASAPSRVASAPPWAGCSSAGP